MSTYVISDIHGELKQLKTLLKKINFSDEDTLYILGDVVDRGPNPIKALQYLMTFPNVVCIVGNHEIMCLSNLKLLMNELTDEFLDNLSEKDLALLSDWTINGAETTMDEFAKLSLEEKGDIVDFLGEFIAYDKVSAGGKEYLLVHAGINNFSRRKHMDDYDIHDLVWTRVDYEKAYFKDIITVSGHTPTQLIEDNPKPGYIYKSNNHVAIDCGACFKGGRLAAYCLDTGEEFYSR